MIEAIIFLTGLLFGAAAVIVILVFLIQKGSR